MAKKYSENHIWVEKDGNKYKMGLSAYALEQLKALLFISLPDKGDMAVKGRPFGDIESIKTVEDLISPINGKVVDINGSLIDDLQPLMDKGEDCWMVAVSSEDDLESLMDDEQYKEYISKI